MIVKHSYISVRQKRGSAKSWNAARLAAVGAALGHLKYIQHRPGEDKEREGRGTFDQENDHADTKAFKKEIRGLKTRGALVHKLIFSPDVTPADPKAFTREIMSELGEEKALDYNWQAVVHSNTRHPHVHVMVLARDKNGREVRFDKRDHKRMKELGDRFLDREHPLEREQARLEREQKERERKEAIQEQRRKERQEKIDRGEYLPWFRHKIVREQLEPYHEWKRAQAEKELLPEPVESSPARQATDLKEADQKFVYDKKEYTQDSSREELEKLNRYLWENKDDKEKRLPKLDYEKLQSWLEVKDREHISEFLQHHPEKIQARDQKRQIDDKSRVGGKVLDPMQQAVATNPAVGALVQAGAVIGMVVGMIRLDDLRDPLGEAHQYLMGAYGEVKEIRSERAADLEDVSQEDKTLNQIEKGLDKVEEKKSERAREEERKREEAEKKREKEMRDGMEGFR